MGLNIVMNAIIGLKNFMKPFNIFDDENIKKTLEVLVLVGEGEN